MRGLDIRKPCELAGRGYRVSDLVSVPLRGLDIRKREQGQLGLVMIDVSVPLRGLDIRKQRLFDFLAVLSMCFSPLAGIRYSETTTRL